MSEALKAEFRRAHAKTADRPVVEPTDEEKRNGWTAETLTAYVADQEAAQSVRSDPSSVARKVVPTRANSRYSPHRWRRR